MQSITYTAPKARRISLLLSTGLMAMWLLTACGGSSDPTPTTVPPADTPAAVEPTTAPETQAVTGTQAMTGTQAVTGTGSTTETGNVTGTGTVAAPLTGMDTQLEAVTINLHEDATLGPILVDGGGMTLYLFDKDEVDKSNCTGDCLVKWPPILVVNPDEITAGEGVTGTVDTLALADGTYQVLYAGHPLYYYEKDTQPGETTGQAVGEVWWVVDAGGNAVHGQ